MSVRHRLASTPFHRAKHLFMSEQIGQASNLFLFFFSNFNKMSSGNEGERDGGKEKDSSVHMKALWHSSMPENSSWELLGLLWVAAVKKSSGGVTRLLSHIQITRAHASSSRVHRYFKTGIDAPLQMAGIPDLGSHALSVPFCTWL